MIICGIKFTHDASVAVIEDGRLRFCIEVEKLNNNKRYSEIEDVQEVRDILEMHGISPKDVDRFVIDGWHGSGAFWRGDSVLSQRHGKQDLALPVASYNEVSIKDNVLARLVFKDGLPIGVTKRDYASYMHVAGHIMGTYCASPFAQADEPAYVLAWDGGQYPRLYFVDPRQKTVVNKGRLFCLLGTIYSVMGHYFGPYKRTADQLAQDKASQTFEGYFGGYSIAGKLMSYIALGTVRPELLGELSKIFDREFEVSNAFEHKFQHAILRFVDGKDYSDADVLLTQHTFIEELLVSSLRARVSKDRMPEQNFCFTGGSALNIKWNSAIRASGVFKSTWVAPYPNDCGNGLGAACCEMVTQGGPWALDWSVYAGPAMPSASALPGWQGRPCSLDELADVLAQAGEPIVFLNGKAEIGPRALGNRSILAPATDPQMKTVLNRIKKREDFRPVAPICMEEHAPGIFDPGTHDPYMLFDHEVREAWRERIPAVRHLDDTARLQTVNATENAEIYGLLQAYYRRTGIPLLCNTSANLNGSGFFPDAHSAMRWGGVARIYCNGTLFEKTA
ncbi:MAG: carbamoyltransferase N-terminal domain-containing protein [Rhizobacter sp.]